MTGEFWLPPVPKVTWDCGARSLASSPVVTKTCALGPDGVGAGLKPPPPPQDTSPRAQVTRSIRMVGFMHQALGFCAQDCGTGECARQPAIDTEGHIRRLSLMMSRGTSITRRLTLNGDGVVLPIHAITPDSPPR